MASYSACFISDFATVAAPFLRINSERYKMGMEGDFQKLKLSFSETTVMTHYDPQESDMRCLSCWCKGNACAMHVHSHFYFTSLYVYT